MCLPLHQFNPASHTSQSSRRASLCLLSLLRESRLLPPASQIGSGSDHNTTAANTTAEHDTTVDEGCVEFIGFFSPMVSSINTTGKSNLALAAEAYTACMASTEVAIANAAEATSGKCVSTSSFACSAASTLTGGSICSSSRVPCQGGCSAITPESSCGSDEDSIPCKVRFALPRRQAGVLAGLAIHHVG